MARRRKGCKPCAYRRAWIKRRYRQVRRYLRKKRR